MPGVRGGRHPHGAGAAAICGLPPLNGFVSELPIYVGAFRGVVCFGVPELLWGLLVLGSLALIGGLAVACFTKAVGIVFLGEPRSAEAAAAREVGPAMTWPMVVLAQAIGLVGPAARASGCQRDVRHGHPAGFYRFAHLPSCTWNSGDVFARAYVRWLEVQRSLAFLREQLDALPAGPILAELPVLPRGAPLTVAAAGQRC